jgi:PBP1b-binding outer membrane lipoprotein LpoB
MKKLFIVLAVASVGFVACNNDSTSEEQKRIDDSIAAKQRQDSIDNANKPVETMPTPAEIEAKRVADSTHVADSLKAANKK